MKATEQPLEQVQFDIAEIVEKELIRIEFQPILSLKLKKAVGVEALCRGINPADRTVISPIALFTEAKKHKMVLALDRLCRKKAMIEFSKIPDHDNLVLFLNFDASVLDNVIDEDKSWTKIYADEAGLKYQNIAVEILESKIENNSKLEAITEKFSSLGMFVVLDDFGALHSNLNRLVISKPDIIKIDRSLIHNVSQSYYQQSIIKSIIDLGKKIGSLTLAEGVESKEDVMKCHELGADLFQGFFFARPKSISDFQEFSCKTLMDNISFEIKDYMALSLEQKRFQHASFESILNRMLDEVVNSQPSEFQQISWDFIKTHKDIECVYFLNDDGVQFGDTICGFDIPDNEHSLFHPSKTGTDHSLKEYFYFINSLNLLSYYTDPYISLATGMLCRTMAKRFDCGDKNFILCIDFIDSRACNLL
ncbi:EAL domain-containing protein (putative c-di-GMP-specific phosphodiesterase class I) [Seleniivibrio woodruffii]|uniref:EAL domain-containing protein (Putative c-di-GMP-specific phosphodiesterase class I) n=1 Tax=Seleniivibrio woodruffii TaxID=1078050 RepID=A0A4R1K8B4_9BACT|nr:EAL domain-containing protein (putative c-di-GMP-specific phosphodiesterase class I) [Seleniivibrio woodruffii]TVZ36184.1 EAL domain-containing protein (putative c-di-GMP-specific phosphodiesterase class I) [Seleniivibrio woodruffii]